MEQSCSDLLLRDDTLMLVMVVGMTGDGEAFFRLNGQDLLIMYGEGKDF